MKHITHYPNRKSPFCVSVQTDGKRKRRFFPTEKEALAYLKSFNKKKTEQGLNALFFFAKDKSDYEASLILAKQHGFDQTTAFIAYLLSSENKPNTGQNTPPASVPATMKKKPVDAFWEYYEQKERIGRAKYTLFDIKKHVLRFCSAFEKQPLALLTQKQVIDYCTDSSRAISPRSRRNTFTALLSFLRFCNRQGYISFSLDIDRSAILPRELKKQKTVFSLGDVKKILACLQSTPALRRFVPFFALQLFCGIRRAEAERMHWNLINFERKEIRLPAEITKTGDEHILRAPFLPDTVFHWLRPFRPVVNLTAKIPIPSNSAREHLVKAVGNWQHNGCRHTFATMHVSLHGDPAKTSVLLRHRNQQRLWQNYLARLVPEAEAREYFNLRPCVDKPQQQ